MILVPDGICILNFKLKCLRVENLLSFALSVIVDFSRPFDETLFWHYSNYLSHLDVSFKYVGKL